MTKVILGLSGGVDSSVSARLLQQAGYEVIGLYLDIGTEAGRQDAIRAAESLGVELRIEDVRQELEEAVCAPFTACYLRGETPSPCILCNPAVKFARLLRAADELGAEFIATGHYARCENGALYKGRPANDQSYMLSRLRREQVQRLLLPLGPYEKSEVRALAREMGLPTAAKPDSMEICFIPDKDYVGYLERRGTVPPPGDFVFHGEVIGRHEGIHRYTVGQRRPGLYQERKLYIAGIDASSNTIRLALWEELFTCRVRARDMRYLIDPPDAPLRGSVKVRHTKWECPDATLTPTPDGGAVFVTDTPLRAPAPGQVAAFYQGERVIGGGFIVPEDNSEKS